MDQDKKQEMWDLWNLHTLFPDHGPGDLVRILSEGKAFDRRQTKLFANPHEALARLKTAATIFLAQNSALKNGLIISLHLGPYSMAPVPWLLAGMDVHVLVNKMSLAEIKPIYNELQKVLPLPGKVIWIPIEGPHFALKIVRALRRKQLVFAFLDGNDGLGGSEETLQEGMSYQLPGRKIKVRTGLARLAARCGAPIHSVVTVWPAKGIFQWERGPTWDLNRHSPSREVTASLFDWAFGVITKHASQWRCWNMLTGVYESFAEESATISHSPIPDSATIIWTGSGKLWPGDILEDLVGHCFYAAEGLSHSNIEQLNKNGTTTMLTLKNELGTQWVAQHLPRLAALGFVTIG